MEGNILARPKRWETVGFENGIGEYRFSSWKYYANYIQDEMLNYNAYIWRGQNQENWKLQPSLDRIFKGNNKSPSGITRAKHLEAFKYAVRGRRGLNPPTLKDENEWWALGQHQGLLTPLLDWTTSPYVAAYFAYFKKTEDVNKRIAIFALHKPSIERKSNEIIQGYKSKGRPPVIEFVNPLSDDNLRLVNQGGLFTRSPDNISVEEWVNEHFIGYNRVVLLKMTFPNKEREFVLQSLNRMNINHLSLFPDLYGASQYSNLELQIAKY